MSDELIPTVYVAIGVPGCGKFTWWNNGVQNLEIPSERSIRINMDSIREDLTGDAGDQSKNGVVAKIANQNLLSALANKIPLIYWDNTSASPKYRKAVIRPAKEAGYNVVGVYFDLPLEVVKGRNANRDRVVPEHVLDRIFNSIAQNPPTLDEGFDNIYTISE